MQFEVYSSGRCPFCLLARRLLNQRGYPFAEYAVDREPGLRAEMEQRAAGRSSVPQIFLGDTHIGGFDELQAMDSNGQLARLASEAGLEAPTDNASG
ncbi:MULTISPECIES: glutaredoxin 3 [Thioalkalivibrio]|uniref:Glutaredoxin n=1 Tax=Thioalkalivibrio versutus TaxID=106634 RepID=A0A0G3G692_9GAMM|nr:MULTISPECIES: glutaredoxin 3 [Thioalkalivibrio]AKJ95894.1 glutaredoxin [Thioalkalivibrio versutus]